jgi:hypothetical protein
MDVATVLFECCKVDPDVPYAIMASHLYCKFIFQIFYLFSNACCNCTSAFFWVRVQTSGNHVREGVEWCRPAMVLVEFSCAGPNDGADTIRRRSREKSWPELTSDNWQVAPRTETQGLFQFMPRPFSPYYNTYTEYKMQIEKTNYTVWLETTTRIF